MFFTWSSAMREIKRIRVSGVKANMLKKWYGWIIVDVNEELKDDEEINKKT